MNIYDKTNSIIRDAHTEFTHDFTVRQFSWDSNAGSNEYADGDWTVSTSTKKGSIRKPELRDTETGPEGQDPDTESEIYFSADDVAVELGEADQARATEFVDSSTGLEYKAVDYHDQGSLVRVFCVSI